MPCSSEGDMQSERIEYDRLRKEVNKLTRLLCYVRHYTPVRTWKTLEQNSAELTKWRIQHDAEDAKRIAKEEATAKARKAKADALAKLSKADRIALGIHE